MIASVMGMGRVRRLRSKKGPTRSCYRYELSGRNAIDFLILIGPHLIEKSYQASLLIKLDKFPTKSMTKKALIQELKLVKLVNY